MNLTATHQRLGALRDVPRADRPAAVRAVLDDLTEVVQDERVEDNTALNMLTMALRALDPRSTRPRARQAGLTHLQQLLELREKWWRNYTPEGQ